MPYHGRTSTRWLREIVDREDPVTGKTKRQSIAEHLLEMATQYTVIHCGRDLELASGRDSVEAAKILFSYCYGKPPASTEEQTMRLAEHFRQVALDSVEVGLKMLGAKLQTMDAKQLAEFWRECEANPSRFIDAARAAMDKASGDAPQLSASPPAEQPGDSPPGDASVLEREAGTVRNGGDDE